MKSSNHRSYLHDNALVSFFLNSVLLLSLLFVFLTEFNHVYYLSVVDSAFSTSDVQQANDDTPPVISYFATAGQSYAQQAYNLYHLLELPKKNNVVLPGNRAPPVA